jgi:hypothetical protein
MDTSMVVEEALPVSPTQSHYMVSIRIAAQTRKWYKTVFKMSRQPTSQEIYTQA